MTSKRKMIDKADAKAMKLCCADLYQRDWMRLLLGDSFHPGGSMLTERLGTLMNLEPGQRVLDVASGQGTSAILLAQRFGCQVLGIDYGNDAVNTALQTAADVSHCVSFQQGDAEHLSVLDETFDAVICECAFCTFPDKQMAASEFTRVLKSGGHVGLSDLTRSKDVVEDLQSLLAWIACIADAQPIDGYINCFAKVGLTIDIVEQHDDALADMVHEIQGKLLGAEMLTKLQKIELPDGIDFEQAKSLAKSAAAAIQAQQLGYVIITATKPMLNTL